VTRILSPEHIAKLKAGRLAKAQAIEAGTAEHEGGWTCGVCGKHCATTVYAFVDKYRCTECAERVFAARDAGHPPGSRIMKDGSVLPPLAQPSPRMPLLPPKRSSGIDDHPKERAGAHLPRTRVRNGVFAPVY
jgi:hypothetical protein